jgi:transcriptional regulator
MFTPRHFAEADVAGLDALVARDPFATLVTVRDGAPSVTHLPVLYARDGDAVELRGHWSRANPQWRDGAARALAIVHGPHAYVSPSWYPDKAAAARVPTWNYAVAHLHGALDVIDDAAFVAQVVADLSTRHESAIGGDWRYEPDNAGHVVQLKGIVGFRLRVDAIELKFKLNQNHPAANVRGAAAALAAGPRDADREIAALMLDRLARRPPGDAA